jgi:hypothetical protein
MRFLAAFFALSMDDIDSFEGMTAVGMTLGCGKWRRNSMQEYKNGQELIVEIEKTAKLFIAEFDAVEEKEKSKMLEGVDRSPVQMIAFNDEMGWGGASGQGSTYAHT